MAIQIVELHFSQLPHYDYGAIKARAEAILGEELDSSGGADTYLLFHQQHPIQYTDGVGPAQTAFLAAHKPIDVNSYTDDIQQSWRFRDCEAVLTLSKHTLFVTELMARLLEPADRVRLFHGVLQAAVEITHPEALVFKHSQQVVQPGDYLEAVDKKPILRPGTLNVRFFNIEDSDGDMLMDTRGLDEIGLHDLQCHFRKLDPHDVSNVLYNTAVYIFENGAVIEAGHTVAGVGPNSNWVCQFENSMVEPARELLDLNPGPGFAAGNRH
jgi:hypothetical protein